MQQYMMHQRCGFRSVDKKPGVTEQHLFSQWVWGFQPVYMQQFHHNDKFRTLSTGPFTFMATLNILNYEDEFKPSDWFLMVIVDKSLRVEQWYYWEH